MSWPPAPRWRSRRAVAFPPAETTKLLTAEEAMEAMKVGQKVAAIYKPPAG